MTRPLAVAACAALVGWFAWRGERFIAANGPTFDEGVHLAAGYGYWTAGDFRLNREDPPLLKLVWALPAVLGGAPPLPSEAGANHWHVADAWLYRSGVPPRQLLDPARRVNLALGCALVGLVGWVAYRVWGTELAGVAGCGFAAADPTLLALSCVLTTDVGVSLFGLLACHLLWEYAAAPSRGLLAGVGVTVGLALGAKFSAVGLVAGLGLAGAVFVGRGGTLALPGGRRTWRPSPAGEAPATSPQRGEVGVAGRLGGAPDRLAEEGPHQPHLSPLGRGRRGAAGEGEPPAAKSGGRPRAAADFAVRLGAVAAVTVAATYGFVHVPEWAAGLKFQLTRGGHGDGVAYLSGEASRAGWYHYFLVALGLKLPLGLLLAAGVSAVSRAAACGRCRPDPRWVLLVVPPLAFFALASAARVNVGVRAVAPVLPFLYLLAAGSVVAGCCRAVRVVVPAVCLALCGVAAQRANPYEISSFNELAGGPAGGARHLADSNLDWGQGLPALKRWMDANGVEAAYLGYFGTDRPEAHGIRFRPLPGYGRVGPPGGEVIPADARRHVVAVSTNHLLGLFLNDPDTYAWLRGRPPVAVPGHCVHVFDLTGDPEAVARVRATPSR
ncbi:MAG: hypothetical protein C0501_15675 [Isosphaera sp.]|nr:hypothetical protein [Isosphaera sp.]